MTRMSAKMAELLRLAAQPNGTVSGVVTVHRLGAALLKARERGWVEAARVNGTPRIHITNSGREALSGEVMNQEQIEEALSASGQCVRCSGDGSVWNDADCRDVRCPICNGSRCDPGALLRAVQAVGHLLLQKRES